MKYQAIYAIATLGIILAACTEKDLTGLQDTGDRIISYDVVGVESAQTKSPDGAAEATYFSLSDESGKSVISVTGSVSDTGAMTKGALVNTTGEDSGLSAFTDIVSTFQAKVYDNEGVLKHTQTVIWSEDESAWKATPTAYWTKGERYTIYSTANLPGSQTATIGAEGISLDHTVPATAASQKDMLFGHYSGNGGKIGRAEMSFEHPLTAVRFIFAETDASVSIKRIALGGVAASGTVAMDASGGIAWNDVAGYDHTVSQESATGLEVDASGLIGESFILIPQDLSAHNVTLSVTLSDNTVLTAAIGSGQWQPGMVNTYTLTRPVSE